MAAGFPRMEEEMEILSFLMHMSAKGNLRLLWRVRRKI